MAWVIGKNGHGRQHRGLQVAVEHRLAQAVLHEHAVVRLRGARVQGGEHERTRHGGSLGEGREARRRARRPHCRMTLRPSANPADHSTGPPGDRAD